ncbi:AAA family ATPase, partial [Candidatus Saccharibacteria bacterium]|nr:AAA family ATPase [Candidatus Saccharibacteria bacterium]
MAKALGVRYVCSNCGAAYGSWQGRCSNCGEWNTLQQQVEVSTATAATSGKGLHVESITKAAAHEAKRLSTKISEIDEVLGGGLVAGSVNLLAGQPGIGKSTLLLQLAHNLAGSYKVLYVSGEESVRQVALRAERLGADTADLQLAVSTVANDIAATIAEGKHE